MCGPAGVRPQPEPRLVTCNSHSFVLHCTRFLEVRPLSSGTQFRHSLVAQLLSALLTEFTMHVLHSSWPLALSRGIEERMSALPQHYMKIRALSQLLYKERERYMNYM